MQTKLNISDSDILQGFGNFAEKTLKDFGCAGAAVAVIKDGEVILSQGYGYRDIKTKEPVDSDTLFAIGSTSKAFTSFDLGILADQGKLDWDKPVKDYMPAFALKDSYASQHITTRDMLCHRSGLPAHTLMWYNSQLSRKDLLHRLRYLDANLEFRYEFQYANMMYLAAGCLVEELSGETWEEFTKKNVFIPLGMTRSNFSVEDCKKEKNAALPYATENNQPKEIPYRDLDAIGPAGSINSCLNDMVKWVQMHLNQGTFADQQLLSDRNLSQILSPIIAVPPSFNYEYFAYKGLGSMSYGMGWFINDFRGSKLIQHGGSIDGFLACVSFMPEKNLGVICLCNQSNSLIPYLFAYTLYDCLLGLPSAAWDEQMMVNWKKSDAEIKACEGEKEESTPVHPLEAYTGEYWNPGYGIFKISLEKDQLKGRYNLYDFSLEHIKYDSFITGINEGLPIVFSANFDGDIISLAIPLEPALKDIVFTRKPSESLFSREILQVYCGKYRMVDGSEILIRLSSGNKLSVTAPNIPEMDLEALQSDKFRLKDMQAIKLNFKRDSKGVVNGFDLLQPGSTQRVIKI